jgi:Acetyltransferase (GNAT) family
LDKLAERARAEGIGRLSLSVETENPARRLYERLGYVEISRDETGGVRMVLDLQRRRSHARVQRTVSVTRRRPGAE